MLLSDIQPQYFPRQHYFARMLASDVFVIRDDVQFVRSHRYPDGTQGMSYQAHTPIKAPAGEHLLTVSIKKGSYLPIKKTCVSYDQNWIQKHIKGLNTFYSSSQNVRALVPEISQLLDCRFAIVSDLNLATICWALGQLLGERLSIPGDLSIARINELLAAKRITRLQRIVLGSDYLGPEVYESTCASERTMTLCKMLGADEYMAGGTAVQAYLDADLFRRDGIKLSIQDWKCPVYQQQYTSQAGFIANLSVIDLLMNAPIETTASSLGVNKGGSSGRPLRVVSAP